MGLDFEYDPAKAASNHRKHGVSFEEAASAFADPLSMTIHDAGHSVGERRWVLLGMSFGNRLVVVAHTELGDRVRLISARLATPDERRQYEQED